jgi:hypothetical protein
MEKLLKNQQIPLTQVIDPNTGQIYYSPQNVVYQDKNNTGATYLRDVIVDQAVTASYFSGSITNAISASYALTASYALNAGGTGTPFRIATGSISASVNTGPTIFLITNNNIPVLTVSQSGVVILATQSIELTGAAPNGGIYFTSSSLFIGLD